MPAESKGAVGTSPLLRALRPPSGSHLSVSATILIRILAGILVLMLILSLLGIVFVRRSFPTTSGELSLPGLDAPVTVTRDSAGIPTVEADTAHDLFLAQGFVHAQDRFWEMDFRRHVTSGRLSELFGESQVGTDTFIRTLGWRRVAEAEVENLDLTTHGYYEAYAQGVNAYLADRSPTEASLEYGIAGMHAGGIEIEEWTPVDSVSWLKAMAWDLRSNIEDEIDRALAGTELDDEQMADVFPDYPYGSRPTIIDGTTGDDAGGTTGSDHDPDGVDPDDARAGGQVTDALSSASGTAGADAPTSHLGDLKRTLASLPALLGRNSHDLGSNSWVVSGDHTERGAPLLANDPHLSPAMPSVWHQIGLRCRTVTEGCPFDVTGFSFSGLPGIVIGHNQSIAWGLTNLGADVADLVVEKIRHGKVIHDDGDEPVQVRKETLQVARSEPHEITIRSTRHGPLVSNLDGAYRGVLDASLGTASAETKSGPDDEHYGLALEWTALQPGTTAQAIFAIDQAKSWKEFRHAASLFDVPAQNLVYADVEGNIGYQAPGKIPRRGDGDGRLPRQGWKSAQDWQGWIDFADLPHLYNPERGWIVTANNPVTKPGAAVRLSDDFDVGDRATRITELLEDAIADGPVSAEDLSDLQGDDLNPLAPHLVPMLLDLETGGDTQITAAQTLLSDWDRRDSADSAAAAYFNVAAATLLDQVFAPKMPSTVPPTGGSRWYLVIENLLQEPDSQWWSSREGGDRDAALRTAMRTAWTKTQELLGPEPATWRWGTLHALTIRSSSLGESGVTAVEKLFNRGPYEVSGGSGVVNATGWDAAEGFETNWVPSMRQIVDLDDFDSSRWINLTGASGHAFHSHYADQTEDWAANRTRPWPYSPAAVADSAEDTLTLMP